MQNNRPRKTAGFKKGSANKTAAKKKSTTKTSLGLSIKPTTDKVGDVLVNQSGVRYTIIGERFVEPSGYQDGKTKARHLIVKANGVGTFEVNDHEFKWYRDHKILQRLSAKQSAKKSSASCKRKK